LCTRAFVQTPALALLPGVLDRLARAAPDLQVEVTQCETSPALADLRSHAIDLVVGIEYDPVPVARHRDVDRRDLMREDVLLALPPQHPALTKRGPVPVAACEDAAWATGHGGTGLDAVVRNVCNRLGGFEPDIRRRSDDALVLSALVASGRAVALFPALLAMTMPQIAVRRLREKRLQRTIFTATRTTTSDAPAVVAARTAFAETARRAAAQRPNLALLAYRM
jgi:DNA-binding transcriptional LysR family regulator